MNNETIFFHEFKAGITDFADKAQQAGKKVKKKAEEVNDKAKDKLDKD